MCSWKIHYYFFLKKNILQEKKIEKVSPHGVLCKHSQRFGNLYGKAQSINMVVNVMGWMSYYQDISQE